MFRMKIKPRSTREPTGQQSVPIKKIAKKKARTSPRGKMIGDGSRVQIRKMGPLCPVWGYVRFVRKNENDSFSLEPEQKLEPRSNRGELGFFGLMVIGLVKQ